MQQVMPLRGKFRKQMEAMGRTEHENANLKFDDSSVNNIIFFLMETIYRPGMNYLLMDLMLMLLMMGGM